MMKTATFKEWTLDKLDKAFGLNQILVTECEVLKAWQTQAASVEINAIEKQVLLDLQEPLIWAGKAWNEVELENKFISPLIMLAKIDDRKIGYFLEHPLAAEVGDYALSGTVDGMIAKGFRSPDIPYFCMNEYKRGMNQDGNPDGQALAAMLVARQLNGNQKPIYGLYIIGTFWNFMVLNPNNTYCVSQDYTAATEAVFAIFKMIKAIKAIIHSEYLPFS